MAKGRMRAKGVTFDAYRTLIDTRDVFTRTVREVLRYEGLDVDTEAFQRQWSVTIESMWEEPFCPMFDLASASLDRTFRAFGHEGDPDRGVRIWWGLSEGFGLYPEVRRVLAVLDGLGIPYAVVSNGDDALLRWHLSLNRLAVEHVITSEQVRAYKPRPEPFAEALGRLGLSAAEVVHVGDSQASDVLGAQRMGMGAIWLDRGGHGLRAPGTPVEPDASIETLEGVLAHVEGGP